MSAHIIERLKSTETPSRMVFFDSESWVDLALTPDTIAAAMVAPVESEHKLYLISACYVSRARVGYSEKWVDYADQTQTPATWTRAHAEKISKDFWVDVDKFTPKKRKTVVFAHNARYDVLVTSAVPAMCALGYTVSGFSDSNPFFLRFVKLGKNGKSVDKSVMIVSSTNYFQFSLEKLGECFKVPKMQVSYSSVSVGASIPYCRNDVLILKTAMMYLVDYIKSEDLGCFKITIAGQSFSAYRRRFMVEDIYVHKIPEVTKLERDAYAGGRTECWRIGKVKEKTFYMDVTSMYPFIMMTKIFPKKLLSHRKHVTVTDLADLIARGFLVVARVKVNTNDPAYFKKDGKLIFPVGEFTTTLCTPEISHALTHGHITGVEEVAIYEGAELFHDYVKYFFDLKNAASAAGDDVLTLVFKLFLNSLYGKFGQKQENYEVIGSAPASVVSVENVYSVDHGKRFQVKTFGGSVFKKESLGDGHSDAYDAFPAIAAHVTAYARVLLWEYVQTAGVSNVFYMDTDSIFCSEVGYKRLLLAGCVDGKTIGKLKLEQTKKATFDATGQVVTPAEYEAPGVEIRGCKDYIFEGAKSGKIKGVSKSSVFLGQDATGADQYISQVWPGFAKALKDGELGGYKNYTMVKRLAREYTKGVVNGVGEVEPLRLSL